MSFWYEIFWSSPGRKIITSISGIGLYIYIILHLAGNLTLFTRNPDIFNRYSHFLIGLGWFLVTLELILLAAFLFHLVYGSVIWVRRPLDRPQNYRKIESAGPPSHKTLSSTTMIWTGIVIAAFVIWHVKTFKYGPGIAEGYVTIINGVEMRDLYRLVIEVFSNKYVVIWYVVTMLFLGFHLRHAFWSSLQSLGANNKYLTPIFYTAGVILAILLAAGFLALPIFVYFTGGRL